ncbi:MAG: hypothetical protein HPKKFMNG_02287 [Planctomycetes bacterium]|nr:hypothetical protein [Planctomycetota bacterium]
MGQGGRRVNVAPEFVSRLREEVVLGVTTFTNPVRMSCRAAF